MWDPREEVQSATLPNGLKVYSVYWPKRPWVSMGFLVHSGAHHDKVGLEGTAHFLEHMVSRNAVIPYKEIKEFFENGGGGVKLGATGYLETFYSCFVSVDQLQRALGIFSSILMTAEIRSYVEEQRQVILSEFQRRFPLVPMLDLAWRETRNVFGGTYMERHVSPLGMPNSIWNITREDLQSFYNTHYTPANISIVCVGGLRLEELLEKLSFTGFGNLKPGERSERPSVIERARPPLESRYVFEASKHVKTEKPRESGAYHSTVVLPGTISREALTILRRMTDKVMFEEVRERRGWTYATGAKTFGRGPFHCAELNADALKLDSLSEIEAVVNSCLESLSDRDDLFRNAVEGYISASSMTDFSGNSLCDALMWDLIKKGRIITNVETDEVVSRLTMDDMRALLSQLGPEQRYTVLTVP